MRGASLFQNDLGSLACRADCAKRSKCLDPRRDIRVRGSGAGRGNLPTRARCLRNLNLNVVWALSRSGIFWYILEFLSPGLDSLPC